MTKKWIIFFLFLGALAFCLPDLFGYSVEADKNYDWGALRKSGGTMTGPLIGTDATFTGTASAAQGFVASLSVTATATFNGVTGISLDEIGDLTTNKVFTLANKTLSFRYTNPAGGIEWLWQGNASGHLFELHQETGNPTADTHLAHIGATDPDVMLLHLVHDGSPTPGYFCVDTTDDASSTGYIFWVNGEDETLIGSDTDAGAFRLQVFGDTYAGGNITVTGTVDGVDVAAASGAFDAHVTDISTHGATTIASAAYVDSRITEADASYTLSLNFTTDSVATHALLMGSHGSTAIASAAHVDQSIATHALLMASHGCAAIASEAYVDAAVASAGSGDVAGNEYRLAAAAASEAIYLSGTDIGIAVASGSAVRFEVDFVAVASDTDTKWGGKIQGMAIASGAIAYLAGSAVTDTWPTDPGALGISAGISGGNLGIYASGTAGSLWKAVRVKSWSLDDEP